MKFRTEIEIKQSRRQVNHSDKLLTVGSCFSDSIGSRLRMDGFDVSVNPTGILFNPISIANIFERALARKPYTAEDLYIDETGIRHCLDFESRRQSADSDQLLEAINNDFSVFSEILLRADRIFVTFGTAWVFAHKPTGNRIVGNCHKLPAREFECHRLDVSDIVSRWLPLVRRLPLVFTVSPVRHLNDGLHGNTLSKAILQLAIDRLVDAEYFPAFEILMDDLRDYRFYAEDLKHPSVMGEDYIYERFGEMFFTPETRARALVCRKQFKQQAHRQIITKS
ncbi:MAG: GSCFA domain-containing protein [Muribaculaceae bacterium]|nr:GSCFA domain-containing protein [Muribaculaceae bacterium]